MTVTYSECVLQGAAMEKTRVYFSCVLQDATGTQAVRKTIPLEYSTLTDAEKKIWDAFWQLCCDKAKSSSGV